MGRVSRQIGFHSEHWSNVGSPQAVDAEIVTFAADHDYVVLTHDLDFGAILAVKPPQTQCFASPIPKPRPKIAGAAVVQALFRLGAELRVGALLTVDEATTRVRLLPLLRDK